MDRFRAGWFDRPALGKPESSPRPDTGPLRVVVTRAAGPAAEFVGVECVVGSAPVAPERADGIFDHPGRFAPFAYPPACLDQFKGLGQPADAFSLKPSCAADGQIGAGREGKDDGILSGRGKPGAYVGTGPQDAVPLLDAGAMADVHADAFKAGLRPGPDHVAGAVAQAENRSA